jgi:hypothetical protein
MGSARYRQCLKLLRMNDRVLAEMIGCSQQMARFWSLGARSIPNVIAAWLETCVKIRLEHPYPPPPIKWHRRPPRPRMGIPTLKMGSRHIW